MRGGWPVLVALLACAAPHQASDDNAHYSASLTAPPAQAVEHCVRIQAPAMRGECVTSAVSRAVRDEPGALDACPRAGTPAWQGECLDRAAEALNLAGAAAGEACRAAGPLRDTCLDHALRRAARRPDWRAPTTYGHEAELYAAVLSEIQAVQTAAGAPDRANDATWALIRELSVRARATQRCENDRPQCTHRSTRFTRALCGATSDKFCGLLYVVALIQDLRDGVPYPLGELQRWCDAGGPSQAAPTGLPEWGPTAGPLAAAELRRRCGPSGTARGTLRRLRDEGLPAPFVAPAPR
jgi:hypothetical protein